MARQVDDVRRRVHRREELRDAHAQVAVHAVGDDLAAVVVQLDVRQVVFRTVVLQRHVHARVVLHLNVVFAHSRCRGLAQALRAPLGANVGLDQMRLVDDDLDEDEFGAHRPILRERGREPLAPLLGCTGPLLLERRVRVRGHNDGHLARVDILAAAVSLVDEVLVRQGRLGGVFGYAGRPDAAGHIHVVRGCFVTLLHELAHIIEQRLGVLIAAARTNGIVGDVEDSHVRTVKEG